MIQAAKPNNQLTPGEVKIMGLAEFERRFGFRPVDKLDKWSFALRGQRISSDARAAIGCGLIPHPDLSVVLMNE
ncbi:hypothetical protein GYB59_02210 [bacterium]|nr:hypothetical protein [bacterium]